MEWMDKEHALRQVVLEMERKADEMGWDGPPVLIDVVIWEEPEQNETVTSVETQPLAYGEHPIDMMKQCFDEGWRPQAFIVIAEGNRTMQAEEAMLMPEWETLPELVRENWRDVMMQFPPNAMEPFVVEVRTAMYVDNEHEWLLIRNRGQEPEWLDGDDQGEMIEMARRVIAGRDPLV